MNKLKRCPSCGKAVQRGHGFKTPKMVDIEEKLGRPLKEVILEYLNVNDSLTVTAELLGTNKQQLYQWMEKLGIRKVSYWEGE